MSAAYVMVGHMIGHKLKRLRQTPLRTPPVCVSSTHSKFIFVFCSRLIIILIDTRSRLEKARALRARCTARRAKASSAPPAFHIYVT